MAQENGPIYQVYQQQSFDQEGEFRPPALQDPGKDFEPGQIQDEPAGTFEERQPEEMEIQTS